MSDVRKQFTMSRSAISLAGAGTSAALPAVTPASATSTLNPPWHPDRYLAAYALSTSILRTSRPGKSCALGHLRSLSARSAYVSGAGRARLSFPNAIPTIALNVASSASVILRSETPSSMLAPTASLNSAAFFSIASALPGVSKNTMVRLGMCCWDSKVMALSAPAASVPPPREACGASYMALFAPVKGSAPWVMGASMPRVTFWLALRSMKRAISSKWSTGRSLSWMKSWATE
mmetsp:Transcript_55309/g.129446  ORF Transcript_55309/g.129446 Transcript_55309/m.129446 type:complete len:234 (-) Transcript_55309:109-810(-)